MTKAAPFLPGWRATKVEAKPDKGEEKPENSMEKAEELVGVRPQVTAKATCAIEPRVTDVGAMGDSSATTLQWISSKPARATSPRRPRLLSRQSAGCPRWRRQARIEGQLKPMRRLRVRSLQQWHHLERQMLQGATVSPSPPTVQAKFRARRMRRCIDSRKSASSHPEKIRNDPRSSVKRRRKPPPTSPGQRISRSQRRRRNHLLRQRTWGLGRSIEEYLRTYR